MKGAGECRGYSAQWSQPTDAEQGYNHAAATCGRGTEYDTFYLITSQTIDSTTDVVQLVVNWRAVMLSPAELNNIFTCSFQPPYNKISLKVSNPLSA